MLCYGGWISLAPFSTDLQQQERLSPPLRVFRPDSGTLLGLRVRCLYTDGGSLATRHELGSSPSGFYGGAMRGAKPVSLGKLVLQTQQAKGDLAK